MELSLFSRDVIAMAAAVALSHNTFDAAVYPGRLRQDRAGTCHRRGQFGYLPGCSCPQAHAVRAAERRKGPGAGSNSPPARSAATS
jgi:hypothetical protein